MLDPSRQPIRYDPSRVSWATSEFVREQPVVGSRIFLYAMLGAALVATAYSAVAPVAISVEARGVLVSESPAIPLRTPVAIKVAKLNVRENQEVKKGDVLIVSADQLSADQYTRVAAQIAQLQALLTQIDNKTCPQCAARLTALAKTVFIFDHKGAIDEAFAPARELVGSLAQAVTQLEAVAMTTSAARRQIELTAQKLAEIKRRGAQQMLAQEMEVLTSEAVSARNLIADKQQSADAAVSNASTRLAVRLTTLAAQLDIYRTQQNMVAPADGVISRLRASGEGEILPAGEVVMEVVPGGAALVAELAIANRDISQVRAGMDVIVRLDALPEREFGAVRGQVIEVPLDIASPSDTQSAYKVRVRLVSQALMKRHVEYPFRMGMALQGLVVTGHQSILQLAIRKLFGLEAGV